MPTPSTFANGLHGTITLTSGELLITDSVTINGPGANQLSVSGNNASRVFEIAAGLNVTISGLTITDGYAPDQGGGILNDGSNLTLSGDDLSQNVAFESATDQRPWRGPPQPGRHPDHHRLPDHRQPGAGAAGASASGDAFGGGIDITAGSATISNSTISGNLAQGGDNSSDGAAPGAGASVLRPTGAQHHRQHHQRQRGRAAAPTRTNNGGLWRRHLDVYGSSTTITGTHLQRQQSPSAAMAGPGAFVGEAEGGAIQLAPRPASHVTISGSTFDHNQAIGGSDGNSGPGNADPGVDESFGGGHCQFWWPPCNVTSTTFSHNKAVGGNNATATGTDIVEVGVAEGGAICNEIGAAATFSGCTFDHNQAIGGNGNTGSGPVVHVGTGFGAGIFSGFGGAVVGPNTLTVSNSTFTQNSAQGGDNNTGTASVAGLVGVGVGAGIMNYLGGTASVSGSELDHNQASGGHHNTAGGTGAVFAGLGAGGGIFNYLGNYNSPGLRPLERQRGHRQQLHDRAQPGPGGRRRQRRGRRHRQRALRHDHGDRQSPDPEPGQRRRRRRPGRRRLQRRHLEPGADAIPW